MTKRKIFVFLFVIVFSITCMPLTAMASEAPPQEIDFLSGGFYITDPDGNIMPTPLYDIDGGIGLPAGYILWAKNNVYYNGGTLTFYASVSGASVADLFLV